ncbi:unnamed protein product [Paramecium octaurelia]|uniref:RING-type domain-containing protein n=1 Tax=Paramecium octaurelia TaxID=43137 RepID=A0A8S1SEW9_PAROT|nr:unnamed protein product [Paramecium octaurelia]
MHFQRILEAYEQRWLERNDQNKKFRTKKLITDTPDIKDLILMKENIPLSKQQQTNQSKAVPKKIRLKQQLQEECPICMINLDDLSNVCEIDVCKHQICLTCIKEWAEKYKTQCPYCRAKFKKIYPIENGKRKNSPIKLNLKQPKWQPEQDQFYNSQEEQEENQKCQLCGCSHSQYLMLICDKCNEQMCHTFCDPGFLEFFVPEKNWYCLDCRKSKLVYHKPK